MSLYKRGKTWWFELQLDGERIRESTRTSNKKQALEIEKQRREEIVATGAGIRPPRKVSNFADFVEEEYLPWANTQHAAKPNTLRRYKVSISVLNRFFGSMRLDRISPGDVEHFKTQRSNEVSKLGSKMSAAGVNRDLAALRVVLNHAKRLGLIRENPVSAVKLFREGGGNLRIVSPEEEERYLSVTSQPLRDIAILMLELGMRPEELFRLKGSAVNREHRFVQVTNGKTSFARRTIPLSSRAVAVLAERLKSVDGEYLFASRARAGRPIVCVREAHKNALRRAAISPAFRLYDLRHTFGSRAAMSGMDLSTLKELMGHSAISITMRYVHPTPSHKRTAIETLEAYNLQNTAAVTQKSPQLVQ